MRQFVGIVLVKQDGSVLSQHRDNKPDMLGPDTWCVVGGAKEGDDRSLKAAAVRELFEETGYLINQDELKELTTDKYMTERGVSVQRVIFYGWHDGRQLIECHEGQEIRFVSPAELNSLTFYTGHEGFLRKASEKTIHGKIEIK